jgi:hypothetical protein
MSTPQQPDRVTERVEFTVHLPVDVGDGHIQRLDLAQMQTQQEAMSIRDPSGQGGQDLLRGRLDASLDQGEQRLGIALAIDQGLQDGGAGHADHVGQDRRSFRLASSGIFWVDWM